jgi:hypothetical protein
MSNTTSSGQSSDDRYGDEGFAFGEDPNDFLVEVAPTMVKGGTSMLGDGEWHNGVWVAEQGHRVVSVDLSVVGVNKAKRLTASRGTTIAARVGGPQSPDLTVELGELEADFAGRTMEVHRAIDRNIVEGKHHHGHNSTVLSIVVKTA